MHNPERPKGERGTLYSVTGHEKSGYYSLWDSYPNSIYGRPDRFSLYNQRGEYVGAYRSAIEAEREASFRLNEEGLQIVIPSIE